MNVVNLTNNTVVVYPESAFQGLTQINATTWNAESVDATQKLAEYPSEGVALISVNTVERESINGIPCVQTVYGELTGIDVNTNADVLIVSLATQSMARMSNHPLASRMVSPFRVIRCTSNTSLVLGCIGFSFQ